MLTTKAIVTNMMIPKLVSLTRFTQSWLLEVSELLTFGNYFPKVRRHVNKSVGTSKEMLLLMIHPNFRGKEGREYPRRQSGDGSGPAYTDRLVNLLEYPRRQSGDCSSPAYTNRRMNLFEYPRRQSGDLFKSSLHKPPCESL